MSSKKELLFIIAIALISSLCQKGKKTLKYFTIFSNNSFYIVCCPNLQSITYLFDRKNIIHDFST